jgi:hypothetical protein
LTLDRRAASYSVESAESRVELRNGDIMIRNLGSTMAACAAIAAMSILAACERAPVEGEPVTLTISGDSINPFVHDTLSDGPPAVDCGVVLRASVEGPEGETITIQNGGVQYYWWQTGVPIELVELSADDMFTLWSDTVMQAGQSRVAQRQPYHQAAPSDPIRAEVRIRYTMSTREGEHETEPFRFYCF